MLPAILADILESTPKTLAEVWNIPVGEFERLWDEKENPRPTPPPSAAESASPVMTLGRLFAELECIERNDATDLMPALNPSSEEVHTDMQYAVSRSFHKQSFYAMPGFEAFRTFVLLEFDSQLTSAVLPRIVKKLLKAEVVVTYGQAEALPYHEVESRMREAGQHTLIRKKPKVAKKSGRRRADQQGDEKLQAAWDSGQHQDYTELAAALRLQVSDVRAAMERQRKRRSKPENDEPVKSE